MSPVIKSLYALLGFVGALRLQGPVGLKDTWSTTQADRLSSAINMDCNLTVNTKTEEMYLHSSIGKFTVRKNKKEEGEIVDQEGTVIKELPKVLLCNGNPGGSSDAPALMFAASSAEYLFSHEHGEGHIWEFFTNKHCWARNNNVQYYLWFGDVPDKTLLTEKEPDAAPCRGGDAGNHHYVIAGVRQLLQEKPNPWIVSMDISDTFFVREFSHKNLMDKFLDPEFDLVAGAAMASKRKFINGAVLAWKKSPWSIDVLAEWFKNRCGPMNQLSLWASLFRVWQKEDPSFKYDEKKMSHYKELNGPGAGTYARSATVTLLKTKEEKDAFHHWQQNEVLPINLHYPHLLIHSNMGTGGVDGVSFRANVDGKHQPFICHRSMHRISQSTHSGCDGHKEMCQDAEQCHCDDQ